MKYEPIAKHYYDGLDEGRFLGLKCPECGHIEFPPYPACNHCGHIGNEWIDLANADVIIHEIYSISPMMTIGDFMPYAPLFSCEASIEDGSIEFTCLIFGVTKKTYKEIREQVPLHGKLVVMPMEGYNSFAVSINGAVPQKKGKKGVMDTAQTIAILGRDKKNAIMKDKESKPDNGIDGTYKCVLKVMGQKRDCKTTVEVDGERAVGKLDAMDQELSFDDGTFIDGQLSFSIEARGSSFDFKGTVGNGKIDGNMKFGMMNMKVSGEKI